MFRFLRRLALVLILTGAGLAGYVYHRLTTLTYERLTDDVFVIYGLGSNVGVLRTSAGTVLVDTMATRVQGKEVRKLAEELTDTPVRVVINSHYHLDHTHGNPAFDADTDIVATIATKSNMLARDTRYWTGDYAEYLPRVTFEKDHELLLGDKTIRLSHLGRGHTDGDLVTIFVDDRVMHTGDLFFNKRYPNIDLEAGGSIEKWIATLDRVIALDFDIVIPGHGLVTNAAGLRGFQTFLRDLLAVGQDAVSRGLTLDQTIALPTLQQYADYETMEVPFVLKLDHDFVVKRSWEEASGVVTYVPAKVATSP